MSVKPEVFGKFILLDKIATGGMAEVYLAKSLGAENVSKFLAVKRILPQFSKNSEFIDMFKEEAKIAINLTHSNIVSMFEFGEVHGQFYLAMEYVEGRNLRQILNRFNKTEHYFTLQDIVYIVKEAAAGLSHAHRYVDGVTGKPLNITHRDISPQNIMVSFEGEIKIVDFGIAKAESKLENTRAGTLKGKFGYMSPEQAEGMEVDYRTDIFSLGIVLWELLARDRLFLANNEMNTLKKIREARVPSLRKLDPSIPEDLERIVNRALMKDRETRYQTTAEVHKDLSRFLNRHFPDYDAEESGEKVKLLYKKERDKMRDNMIEFAKIQMSDFDENTILANEDGTLTHSNNSSARILNNSQKRDRLAPQALLSDEEIKKRTADLEIRMSERSGLLSNGSAGAIGPYGSHGTDYGSGAPLTFPKRNTFPLGRVIGFFFFLSIGVFGYKLLNSSDGQANFASKLKTTIKEIMPLEEAPTKTVQQAEPINRKLVIISRPAGAQIYINGQFDNLYTPAQLTVPGDQPVQIKLKKEGYRTYEARHTIIEDDQALEVNLLKLRVGYLNIRVKPSAAAQVKVNGKELKGFPPFKRQPVAAGSAVTVEAYDPVSNGYAREVFYVKEDNEVNATLFLKKRLPSSR